MITIYYETEEGTRKSTTVHMEDRLWACQELLNKGYYLVGEDDA